MDGKRELRLGKKENMDNALDAVLIKREKCLTEMVSEQVLEEYMQSMQNLGTLDRDIQYSLLLDMNLIEMKCPEAIYPDFYIQKKRMMEELAQSYYGNMCRKRHPDRNQKRIAIFTNTWRDERYSIGIVMATLANEICRQGYEVAVFIENQYRHDERIRDVLNTDLLVNAEDYRSDHEKMLLPRIRTYYSKGDTVREKIVDQIDNIFDYGPSLIIDIADENSCCSRILYENFPLFYFPMRSNHGSSMFFHRYLAVDPDRMKQIIKKYHCFDEKLIAPFTGGITEFPLAKSEYDKREQLGVEHSFVLVTVGNRLVHDLSREFICFVAEYLQEHPQFAWVFVGRDLPDYLLKERTQRNLEKQIIVRGYEKDLIALYHICDVYVNPMRKGGGLSIAWAMHEGLPVAMLKYTSDGLSWIGEENAIDGGMQELGQYLNALWEDKKLYNEESKKMKEKADQRTPARCVEQIFRIYSEMEI